MNNNEITSGGKIFSSELLNRISQQVLESSEISRTEVARRVCEWLDWRNPFGEVQLSSCIAALKSLEERGHLVLPKGTRKGTGLSLRLSEESVPPAAEVPLRVDEVEGLYLCKVTQEDESYMRIWNSLIVKEHPLGLSRFFGRQMRYLIGSSHGWLGGLCFSAAALKLKARENWICWSEEERKENLQKVANMSRFLIRPGIECENLASKVLGLSVRQVQEDWVERYGERLVLLETFVNPNNYKGICFKAANWENIGSTVGRGRQDNYRKEEKAVKDIFVLPLCSNFRQVLCNDRETVVQSRSVEEENSDWVSQEFGGLSLGDERLSQRAEKIAAAKWEMPCAAYPQIFKDFHQLKGAYRFFSNDNEEMTLENLLEPHRGCTLERMANEKVVLAVSDTTFLNYNSLSETTTGLGKIGKNQTGEKYGLISHGTIALNEKGVPLGVVEVQCESRQEKERAKKEMRNLPIEEKETYKWLKSFRAVNKAALELKDTVVVNVCDREGDIYELFEEAESASSKAELLVRAVHDRKTNSTEKETLLWDFMNAKETAGVITVKVPRQKEKPGRKAECELRFSEVELKPPWKNDGKEHYPIRVWVVFLKEKTPPVGEEGIEWMLLTTLETKTFKQASKRVSWYCKRWVIEEWHKVIKSGCKAEERQLETADALKIAFAFDLVIAWRILLMTKLGREVPDIPCTVLFNETEWKILFEVHLGELKKKAPTLQEMIREVAKLGGFLGRKRDGEPGYVTLWRGLAQLHTMTSICCKMMKQRLPDWFDEIPNTS